MIEIDSVLFFIIAMTIYTILGATIEHYKVYLKIFLYKIHS